MEPKRHTTGPLRYLEAWLRVDDIPDVTEQSRVRVLAALGAWAALLAIVAYPLTRYIAHAPSERTTVYGLLAIQNLVCSIAALLLARRRCVTAGATVVVLSLTAVCCAPAFVFGPGTPLFYFCPALMVVAGLLLGRAGVVILLGFLMVAGAVILGRGVPGRPAAPVPPVGHVTAVLFLAVYATVVQELYSGTLRRAVARSQAELEERTRAEESLLLAERRLRTVLDQLPQATSLVDRDGNVAFLNRAALELAGVAESAAIGYPLWDWTALRGVPELRDAAREAILRAAHGSSERLELAVPGPRGATAYLESHIRPVLGGEGEVEWAIATAFDTTDLHRATSALVALHEVSLELPRYRTEEDMCLHAVRLGRERLGFDRLSIWFRDEEPGGLRGTYGVDEQGGIRDERTSRCTYGEGSPTERIFGQQQPYVIKHEAPLCDDRGETVGWGAGGVAALWDGDEVVGCLYYDNLLSARSYGDLEHDMAALYAAALGHLLGHIRAEQARAASERSYREALNATTEAIFVLDARSGAPVDANDTAVRMFGYTREQLLSGEAQRLAPASDEWSGDRALRAVRLAATEGPQLLEWQAARASGELLWTEVSLRLAFIGGAERVLAVVRDITERKEAEEEQRRLREGIGRTQRLESIGLLAGGIAHDFNNILTPILGFTELLLARSSSDPDTSLRLQQILSAAMRARDLVGQILTFSRQTDARRAPARLQPLVREALRLIRASTPATISIRESVDEACGPVLVDATQFHQVVMNLCTNGAHAVGTAGRGGLTVALAEIEMDASLAGRTGAPGPGRYVRLTVSDTGCGMDAATIARIFEPFFTTKAPGEGSGLGLSVVHGIVTSHGGGISVYSEVGDGTTFQVYWPVLCEAPPTAHAGAAALGTPGTGRVLLADDEPAVVSVAVEALEALGYVVQAFPDGRAALEAFRDDPDAYDVVLTDQTMPHLTGSRLAAALRETRPGIPIVVATGFGPRDDPDMALAGKPPLLLAKPYTVRELAETIERALGRDGVRTGE